MTYTADTPILGQGTVSAEAIDAWFAARGPAAAKQFAPDKTYRPAPPGLGDMIVRACAAWGADVRVNHDLIAADIAHESAFWQSAIVRDKNNPSGLGAVNDNPYGGAVTFATPYGGILATVAHMLCYAKGNGPWADSDPRYEAVKRAAWLGAAPTLRGLNGRWAFPGTTYGQSIAAGANALVDFANNQTWEEPAVGRVPKPQMNTSRPSPNRGYDPAKYGPRVAEAFVDHIATGSKASNLNHLTNPVSGASSNYYIAKDGEIFELVPWQFAPWTNGQVNKPDMSNALIRKWVENGWNPNTRCITTEHEGEPGDTLTEAQIASNIALTAWLSQETDIPVDRDHKLGHYQIDSVNRPYCPSFSDVEWARLIDGANALLRTESAAGDDKLVLPGQDKLGEFYAPTAGFVLGFKGVVEGLGAGRYADDPVKGILVTIGYPYEDEWQGVDNCSYQRCQRGTLQFIPDEADNKPFDVVILHRDTTLPARKPAA